MKRYTAGLLAAITAVLLIGPAGAQKKSDADGMFEAARQKETLGGDLKAAIKVYGEIAAKYKNDRAVAAMALVRMGQCYEKLGDAESRKAYERVVREYGDQKEAVTMARARLGATRATPAGLTIARQVWTAPSSGDIYSAVSPDGRYVPYVDFAANGDLFVHDIINGADRRLTNTATDGIPGRIDEYAEESAFSRDSKQVAYSWLVKDRYELRVLGLQGNGIPQVRRLFDNEDVHWIEPDDWSSDGKWIAVQLQRKDHSAQIGLVSVEDGSLRVLKSVDWRGSSRMSFSTDGKYLAFDLPAGDAVEQRDVFVIAVDGSREVPAVVHPGNDALIGWSQDGKHLLFASDRSGSMGIWTLPFSDGKAHGMPELVRPDYGRLSNLGLTASGALYYAGVPGGVRSDIQVAAIDFANGKILSPPMSVVQSFVGANRFPSWSPDGKRLVYSSERGSGAFRYYVIGIRSLDTGQIRELVPSPNFTLFWSLHWMPDGRSVIIQGRDTKGRNGIFRVDSETGRSTVVVEPSAGGRFAFAAPSPDGKRIYYRRSTSIETQGRDFAFIERDLASGEEKVLINGTGQGAPLELSPDGRYLALGSNDPSKPRTLSLVPVAGGEPRELIRENEPRQIRGLGFAEDSSAMYVIKTPGELWRVPLDGSAPKKMDQKLDEKLVNIGPFRVHPDGRQIAFEARGTRKPAEVWVLENFLPSLTATK